MLLIFVGTGLAGMRQRDLIQWYVGQQNEKNKYSSMEEAASEVSKIKAIIEVLTLSYLIYQRISVTCVITFTNLMWNQMLSQSLIRREGHLIVVDDGRQSEAGEGEGQPALVSRNERILAVAPNYVIEWCDFNYIRSFWVTDLVRKTKNQTEHVSQFAINFNGGVIHWSWGRLWLWLYTKFMLVTYLIPEALLFFYSSYCCKMIAASSWFLRL